MPYRNMHIPARIAAFMLAWMLLCACPVSDAWGRSARSGTGLTALSVFWLLPTTIFENTADGLTEDEKYTLCIQGATERWVLREPSPDILEVVSRTGNEATILLRIFRYDDGKRAVAAFGADTGPVCSTELWTVDVKGRATPLDTPEEPNLMDFFAPDSRVPPDVTASLPFCVRPEGLEVRPLFWTSTGLAHVMVDNAVFYVWTGKKFSKRVVPLPPYPAPQGVTAVEHGETGEVLEGEPEEVSQGEPEGAQSLDADGLPQWVNGE